MHPKSKNQNALWHRSAPHTIQWGSSEGKVRLREFRNPCLICRLRHGKIFFKSDSLKAYSIKNVYIITIFQKKNRLSFRPGRSVRRGRRTLCMLHPNANACGVIVDNVRLRYRECCVRLVQAADGHLKPHISDTQTTRKCW